MEKNGSFWTVLDFNFWYIALMLSLLCSQFISNNTFSCIIYSFFIRIKCTIANQFQISNKSISTIFDTKYLKKDLFEVAQALLGAHFEERRRNTRGVSSGKLRGSRWYDRFKFMKKRSFLKPKANYRPFKS